MSMKNKKLHMTELYFKRNSDNLRARRLLAQFLGLDPKECRLPLNECSKVLLRFAENYNELVTGDKSRKRNSKGDRQESLF